MLPDGWEERVSKSTRRIYFYNRSVVTPRLLRVQRAGHRQSQPPSQSKNNLPVCWACADVLALRRYTGQSTWEIPNGPPGSQNQAYGPAAVSAASVHQQYGNQGMGAPVPQQMVDPHGAAYLRQSAPMPAPGSSDYAMYTGATGTGANYGGASSYGAVANVIASNPYAYPQPQPLPYGVGGAPGAQAPDALRHSAIASPREHASAFASPRDANLTSPMHAHTPFSHRSRQSSLQSSLAPSPNTRAAFLAQQQSRSQQHSPLSTSLHSSRPTSAHAAPLNAAPGVYARQQGQENSFSRGAPAYPMPPAATALAPVPSGQLQSEAMM